MTRPRRPVIFDLDGVLVDSEGLAWVAWRAVLSRFDIEVTEEDIATLAGRTFDDDYARFAPRGLPPKSEVRELVDTEIRVVFSELEAFDDAFDAVEALHMRNVPMAVASSSPAWRVDASLTAVGLAPWLPITAGGDEVELGKPNPEVYLLAAERLGVDPATCIAVEDTPVGIAAAQAAGMTVVGVQRTDVRLTADVVVPRITPAVLLLDA